MNEMEVVRMLQDAETVLRNFDGQNLLTQQVRSFKDLESSLPHSPQSQAILEKLREGLVPVLNDESIVLDSRSSAKLHFTLGRLNFLLNDLRKARGHFLNAGRHGLPEAMAFYNVAMTYAVDESLDEKERKQQTIASLRMVINAAGASSQPGMEAALHIKLLELS